MVFDSVLLVLAEWVRGGRSRRRQRGGRPWSTRFGVEGLEERRMLAATLVKDIHVGAPDSTPALFAAFNGEAFFAANDGSHGVELWKSDGAGSGTVLVKNIRPDLSLGVVLPLGSNPANFTVAGGVLFFTADDGSSGVELWKTDGSTAGTVLVKDINPGSASSSPADLIDLNGTLFFTADNGTGGVELWKSDGTAGGTALVEDIRLGSSGSSPTDLMVAGGRLFFAADNGTSGAELWTSDGTALGTAIVTNILLGAGGSNPSHLTGSGGTVYFAASDGVSGVELWKSDGTVAGTVLVLDINPGAASSNPSELVNVGGTLFFVANDGANGAELWKSDGTAAGTVLVRNINASAGVGAHPAELTGVAGALFFRANDGVAGPELWTSDGTSAGTLLVLDLKAGSLGSTPAGLVDGNGTLFFAADNGVTGPELWQSDGTAAGTLLVTDIRPGANGSGPSGLTRAGSALFFAANDGTAGVELWKATLPGARPLPQNDRFTFVAGTTLVIAAPGVLANDLDPDGDALVSTAVVTGPANGSLTLNADGSFSYLPNAGFVGRDTFTYRAGDAGGLSSAMATVSLTSREFAFVENLYADVLGRTAVLESDILFWTGLLTSGSSRGQVAGAFVSSTEYRTNLINGYFQQFLGRAPDVSSLNFFLAQMSQGLTDEGVLAAIVGSNEYFLQSGSDASFVSRLYADLLGRSATTVEAGFWKSRLLGGEPRLQVVAAFVSSVEYRTLVIQATYQQYLGRAAEDAAINFWLAQLALGRSWEDIGLGLLGSDEYFLA